jgi:MarR family transcriptional regulator, transcriptional regulator for hemolysin
VPDDLLADDQAAERCANLGGVNEDPPRTDADLMLLLSHVSHALATEMTAGLEGIGITPRAHSVLSKAMTGDLTQRHLAELCDLDRTTMVTTLDELEAAGLAERRPAPGDRRARIVGVTDAGRRKVGEAQAIVDGIYEDVLASLPPRERTAFVAALERLATGLLSVPAECERPVRRRAERARTVHTLP